MRLSCSFLRALVALGSAAALFAGALEIHPPEAAHGLGQGDAGDAGKYSACDGPHGSALHVEAARATERPLCPVCLHRLETGGLHLPDGPHGQDLPSRGLLAPATAPATLSATQASPGARAPPRLS
jgi:hypothetical protein